jgi:hypothetical protein
MKISKELTKASEALHNTTLVMQKEEAKMQNLKKAFVNLTDPVKREIAKTALIKQSKILKKAEADTAATIKRFNNALSNEPEDINDLMDHKIQEQIVRLMVRKLIKETIEETEPVSVTTQIFNFFNKNIKKLEKLVDDNDWDEFYDVAFEAFPDIDQDDVAQAMNNAALAAGWFENDIDDFRQTEADLDMMANGTKEQQGGIYMGDYDMKMKPPKTSSTELYMEGIYGRVTEAEYRGRTVKLNKPFYTPGGPRKRAVYVKNDKGNVVKVGFGDPNMRIKKSNPARRKSYRARHHCDTPGPKWKANYWSCRAW